MKLRIGEQSTTTAFQALRIGLCALALGTGVTAQGAAPVITNIMMVGATPQFAVQSDLGTVNEIQYCTNLSQTNWVVLTNLVVAQSPYWFVDVAALTASQGFYRVAAPAMPSGMAPIPAGVFTMGDTLDSEPDAIPTVSVTVSAFYMDTNLVSYGQWQGVYNWAVANGYSFDYAGSGKAANHPVQTVVWYDVVKWCNARSQQVGLTPVYYTDPGFMQIYTNGDTNAVYAHWTNSGYRLPTEAEWEKAARGGVSGHRFPWSDADTIDWSRANYWSWWSGGAPIYSYDLAPTSGFDPAFNDGVYPYTSPGGSFAANGYGLNDMAGNVLEWCWDWYATPYAGGTDPRGPVGPLFYRVMRGGSWYQGAGVAPCAHRQPMGPNEASSASGFRCVRGL